MDGNAKAFTIRPPAKPKRKNRGFGARARSATATKAPGNGKGLAPTSAKQTRLYAAVHASRSSASAVATAQRAGPADITSPGVIASNTHVPANATNSRSRGSKREGDGEPGCERHGPFIVARAE